uniref:Uncharacterized protein n=1 Tax=Glossina brevipalpis TaxID=37001 RepID=A0A1A9W251_9MUSC
MKGNNLHDSDLKCMITINSGYSFIMQARDDLLVYANLDIVTAKATKEERAKVKHHLLDVATPYEPFTVLHFRNQALPIVETILTGNVSLACKEKHEQNAGYSLSNLF